MFIGWCRAIHWAVHGECIGLCKQGVNQEAVGSRHREKRDMEPSPRVSEPMAAPTSAPTTARNINAQIDKATRSNIHDEQEPCGARGAVSVKSKGMTGSTTRYFDSPPGSGCEPCISIERHACMPCTCRQPLYTRTYNTAVELQDVCFCLCTV